MTTIDTAAIARKTEQVTAAWKGARGQAVFLAADDTAGSKKWAQFTNDLAKAEGIMNAWVRLNQRAQYHVTRGETFTKEAVLEVVADLVVGGADDTWSGRCNDVQRARYDGVLEAAGEMKWLTA